MIELKNGDCMSALLNHGCNTVDLVVTDPPYGMSFMGKDWDRAIPDLKIFQELHRVLKPGAFCFVMCAPRSDLQWRMSQRLEEAGFRVDFTPIYWTFATGFPKAGNIGKLVDKKMGKEREKLGIATTSRPNTNVDNQVLNWGGHGHGKEQYITKATSLEAKALDGSYAGFQPKPAVEVILAAMKPLSEKTYVEQALDNGKGITWLDDCRVPYESEDIDTRRNARGGDNGLNKSDTFKIRERKANEQQKQQGRFPANLLVSDDVLDDGKVRKSGAMNYKRHKTSGFGGSDNCFGDNSETPITGNFASEGSYSRFFSLDAWAGLAIDKLPEQAQKTFPFLVVSKPSKAEKNKGCEGMEATQTNDGRNKLPDNAFQRGKSYRVNSHPTVKPVTLMRYLITLGSRKGDLVLDPFMGSGTTGIAAKMLGRKFLGVERNPEYFGIAEERINEA